MRLILITFENKIVGWMKIVAIFFISTLFLLYFLLLRKKVEFGLKITRAEEMKEAMLCKLKGS